MSDDDMRTEEHRVSGERLVALGAIAALAADYTVVVQKEAAPAR